MRRFQLGCLCYLLDFVSSFGAIHPPQIQLKEVYSLAEILKDPRVNGLAFESNANRSKYKKLAQIYINFRRQRMTELQRRNLRAQCLASESGRLIPYCPAVIRYMSSFQKWIQSEGQRDKEQLWSRLRRIQLQISREQILLLEKERESDLTSAFKQWESFRLQGLALRVLKAQACTSSTLLTSLGLKFEEMFPDQSSIAMVKKLYGRSLECGKDDSAEKAGYRLALLFIAEKQYLPALKILGQISALENVESGDLDSRIAFWRFYCAKQLNREEEAKLMRERFLKNHLLSLHFLLLASDGNENDSDIRLGASNENSNLESFEPRINFNSQLKAESNVYFRLTEALQMLGANDISSEIIDIFQDQVQDFEPDVQLYVAVLAARSGNLIKNFQILSKVFKNYPSLVAKQTLELFFPLVNLSLVRVSSSRLDPYLILSVIRQESGFNQKAVSRAGAYGLMQILPVVGRQMESIPKRELFNPRTNIRVGSKYFIKLLERYDGDAELAMAAYNAGAERVDDWLKRYPTDLRLLFLDLIPFKETREYVAALVRNYYWYLRLYSHEAIGKKLIPHSNSKNNLERDKKPFFRIFSFLGQT